MNTRNVFILMMICLIAVIGSAQIDPACTALCSAFWTCTVKGFLSGEQCNEPEGCQCREFADW